ncbi:hypothetical protein [Blautia sp. MSJ-9]|uniref:hypothetical protein n=1 Tax=Blautia sp. MSJ-9 TaxID=2841511 RepID=UPI001C125C14|nr:hypothetical protein [Blautia sp. MSJ-9]MBU5679008.1 hypothetical protein [Blautia sp. MSJ-9]
MEFEIAKEYDRKINDELKKYETLLWQTYYSTLLPDLVQMYADNYNGDPADKTQAINDYRAHLIARHMYRVQKMLNKKRDKLISKYMDELAEQLEAAKRVADLIDDLEEDGWNPADEDKY